MNDKQICMYENEIQSQRANICRFHRNLRPLWNRRPSSPPLPSPHLPDSRHVIVIAFAILAFSDQFYSMVIRFPFAHYLPLLEWDLCLLTLSRKFFIPAAAASAYSDNENILPSLTLKTVNC